jgi:hypothetical protein
MKTIGYAIPTFKGHLHMLEELLDTIANSTVLPKEVSVSISSVDKDISFKEYPYKLIITKTSEHKNGSQNRNIAANKLTTDIISFFDGDDLPNIHKNQYTLKAFETDCEVVVHNYFTSLDRNCNFINQSVGDFIFHPKYIDTILPEWWWPQNNNLHKDYHCAHISVKKEIFNKIKYNEQYTIVGEDAEYLRQIFNSGIKICYIENKLSQYFK